MKIGFIGCGNMASAMISGMLKKGKYKKDEIIVSNLTEEGISRTSKRYMTSLSFSMQIIKYPQTI